MKFSIISLLLAATLMVASCEKGSAITTDTELILAIQEASDKQIINAEALPNSASLVLESDYSESYTERAHLAPSLGYEVRIRRGEGTRMGEGTEVYFDLNGRELRRDRNRDGHETRDRNGRDRRECFNLVFPVTFLLPDGTEVTGNAQELRHAISRWYEANPDSEQRPELQYPVEIVFRDGVTVTINEEEQMRRVYERCE